MTDVTQQALRLLVQERNRIHRAIELLQGDQEAPRRRGRPPGSKNKAAKTVAKKRRGRRAMTAAEKKAVSERMQAYWAARRKGKT